MGHCIIMGRKTWDSIGRPLPGRRNIVVTRNPQWRADGAEAATGLDAALALCAAPDAFVIGGAELYAQALRGPVASIHVTEIDADFAGDTVFPPLAPERWRERSRQRLAPAGVRPYAIDFVEYEPRQGPQTATKGGAIHVR